ncbi:MAG: DUF2892 domain-containing protein [Pseudomonadota bacterium]
MGINIGTADRIFRAVLGVVLLVIALGVLSGGLWMWLAAAVGVIMLATSAIKFCPLYRVFGFRTCTPSAG